MTCFSACQISFLRHQQLDPVYAIATLLSYLNHGEDYDIHIHQMAEFAFGGAWLYGSHEGAEEADPKFYNHTVPDWL